MEDDLSLGWTVVLGNLISNPLYNLLLAVYMPTIGQLWARYRPVIGLLLANCK